MRMPSPTKNARRLDPDLMRVLASRPGAVRADTPLPSESASDEEADEQADEDEECAEDEEDTDGEAPADVSAKHAQFCPDDAADPHEEEVRLRELQILEEALLQVGYPPNSLELLRAHYKHLPGSRQREYRSRKQM